MHSVAALIARLLLAPLFLGSGVGKVFNFEPTIERMEAHNVAMPTAALVIAIALELLGILMLLLGFHARIGAGLLLVFLVPVTLLMHPFWAFEDPQRVQMEQIQFFKNMAIIAGLLLLLVHGSGRYSLDRFLKHRAKRK